MQTSNKGRSRSFHPVSGLLYVTVWLSCAMLCEHPLLLLAILVGGVLNLLAAGGSRDGGRFLLLGAAMTPLVLLLNVLFNPSGETLLFRLPPLPFLGERPVTLEALLFGLFMALKIIAVMAVCASFQFLVSQDRFIHWTASRTPRLGLVAMVALMSLPRLRRDMERVSIAMASRGVRFPSGNLWVRVLSSVPLWKALLLNTMESSLDTSEALYARAFGLGKRTRMRKTPWHWRDTLACLTAIAGGALTAYGIGNQALAYSWFPALGPIHSGQELWLAPAFLFLLLLFPLRRPFPSRATRESGVVFSPQLPTAAE